MLEHLAIIVLRREHRIYRKGKHYLDTLVTRQGVENSTEIKKEAVDYLLDELSGRTVSVDDATYILEEATDQLKLPYDHGYKLRFYAQSVLLVLVALGNGSLEKSGRAYLYTISKE